MSSLPPEPVPGPRQTEIRLAQKGFLIVSNGVEVELCLRISSGKMQHKQVVSQVALAVGLDIHTFHIGSSNVIFLILSHFFG